LYMTEFAVIVIPAAAGIQKLAGPVDHWIPA
jgi:hypothetical protein